MKKEIIILHKMVTDHFAYKYRSKYSKSRITVLVKTMHPADLSIAMDMMKYDVCRSFIELCVEPLTAKDITFFEGYVIKMIFGTLGSKKFANIIASYSAIDAFTVIDIFPDDKQALIMKLLPAVLRKEIKERVDLHDHSAGRYMHKNVITLKPYWSVKKATSLIKQSRNMISNHGEVYVIDANRAPVGTIAMSTLLCSEGSQLIESIMNTNVYKFDMTADVNEVVDDFTKYELNIASIIDSNNRFKGVLFVADVLDILEEESEGEIVHFSGIQQEEDKRAALAAVQRLPWLMCIIGTGILSVFIINAFGAIIQREVTLVAAMPMIASIAGNVGMQALGSTFNQPAHISSLIVIRRESAIGIINGILLGCIITVAVMLIATPQWFVAYAAFMATFLSVVFAGVLGCLVPIAFKKINIDPAIASSVVIIGAIDIFAIMSLLLSYMFIASS